MSDKSKSKTRAVVTVDGLAGSGKSTLSRLLAERLGFVHLNSGMLYRTVGLLVLQHGVDFEDVTSIENLLTENHIELSLSADCTTEVKLNGVSIGGQISSPPVSEATSNTSKHAVVRKALINLQRQAFPQRGLVAEGRDMGTVVFPDADVKFFITASAEVRVDRRMEQLYGSADSERPDDKVLKIEAEIEVIARDKRDSERTLSPTIAADEAIAIDNSTETLTKVVQSMYDAVSQHGLVAAP